MDFVGGWGLGIDMGFCVERVGWEFWGRSV